MARIAQTVTTQKDARTIAEDERTGRVYLPTAQYGAPTVVGGADRAAGQLCHLVVAPQVLTGDG